MSPRNPLLAALALIALPLNLLAVLHPQFLGLCLAGLAALALALGLDAWRLRGRLAGVTVELPQAARFALGRPGTLALLLRKENGPALRARLRLDASPWLAPLDALDFTLGPGRDARSFPLAASPVRRGFGRLRGQVLETVSPWGLWTLLHRGSGECEVKVYPGLGSGRSRLSAPEQLPLAGVHARRQLGKGREFDKLREYLHGDDYHDIHWKATAKRGHPVTKVFQIENTQHVYAILDASRLSAIPLPATPLRAAAGTPDHAPHPLEYYLRAALRLGLAAENQGDYYGLALYADRPLALVPSGKGKVHYGAYRDALCKVESRPGSPDYAELFAYLRLRLRKRAMLLFFCSLEEPALAESFGEHIGLLSRQHLVSVNMIRPPDLEPLFAPAPVAGEAEIYRRLAGQVRLRDLGRLARSLSRQGAAFRTWDAARLSPEAVTQYLDAKRRQVLA